MRSIAIQLSLVALALHPALVFGQATVVPAVGTFTLIGCFSDIASARALHVAEGLSDERTVESCLDICAEGNFILGGVEFAGECYCGNALLNNHAQVDDSVCNLACSGDNTTLCGGNNALNLYQNGDTPFTSGAPEILPGTGDWTVLGCFQDNTPERQLKHQLAIPVETMSVETCTAGCEAAGFNVAGLQFAEECWCDTVALPPGIPADDGDCNLQCTENANEFCGAGNRNLVYTLPSAADNTPPAPPPECAVTCPTEITNDTDELPLPLAHFGTSDGQLTCNFADQVNGVESECVFDSTTGLLVSALDGGNCPDGVTPCPAN